MDRSTDHAWAVAPGARRRSLLSVAAAPLVLALLTGSVLTSCSASHDASGGGDATMHPSSGASMHEGADLPPADAAEAWAARPDFVGVGAETEEAYSYALYHPEVLRWMPCYCGCGAMQHRSNLDCYLRPAVAGVATTFDEHASYCDICVKTTLLAKRMVEQGASLMQIRQAVDQAYGDAAPGTNTALPPA